MNRRWFLKHLVALGPAVTITPQLIELLSPRPTIVLPPTCGWYQPSLLDSLQAHADRVRPAGVLVEYKWGELSDDHMVYRINENIHTGTVEIILARNISEVVEKGIRRAIAKGPLTSFMCTRADLVPGLVLSVDRELTT